MWCSGFRPEDYSNLRDGPNTLQPAIHEPKHREASPTRPKTSLVPTITLSAATLAGSIGGGVSGGSRPSRACPRRGTENPSGHLDNVRGQGCKSFRHQDEVL
jgi:hypothetical protein